MPRIPRASQSLVARIKQTAKRRHRADGVPHHETLESEARAAGFASWHELLTATGSAAPVPENQLPVDPALPDDFDCTPNEERTREQLREWWDRPYAIRRDDGRLEVRCLDGGAWDRSTWYGTAETLEEAQKLAARKLLRWQYFREQPRLYLDDGQAYAARELGFPGTALKAVMGPATVTDVQHWLEQWRADNPPPDGSVP